MMMTKKIKRYLVLLDHWMRAVWPLLVTLLGGLYFQEAVVNSVASTPHPALVYTIFGAFAIAALLVMVALYRFLREDAYLSRFKQWDDPQRQAALDAPRWPSDMAPLYRMLLVPMSHESRRNTLENELYVAEGRLTARLTLPGYIAGALVGLGLVGTFVGLLGTLDDLSKLFAGMANMGGKDTNPVELFSDMISRLQAPMKAMGTAFVASLYGLLGSLILGLMSYSAKKTAGGVMDDARKLVNDQLESKPSMDIAADGSNAAQVAAQWHALFEELRSERAMLENNLLGLTGKVDEHGCKAEQERILLVQQILKLNADSTESQTQAQERRENLLTQQLLVLEASKELLEQDRVLAQDFARLDAERVAVKTQSDIAQQEALLSAVEVLKEISAKLTVIDDVVRELRQERQEFQEKAQKNQYLVLDVMEKTVNALKQGGSV
jgi:hypothetical protein